MPELGSRNRKYGNVGSQTKVKNFNIQSIDPADMSALTDLTRTKDEINTNTNLQTDTINTTVLDIQTDAAVNTAAINANTDSKTAAVTTNVNSNTDTKTNNVNTNVEKLKPTPGLLDSTFTSGTTYQTILNYSGQGELINLFLNVGLTAVGQVASCRVTIDGNVYAEDSITGVTTTRQGQLNVNTVFGSNKLYTVLWGASITLNGLYLAPVSFKSSLKIEVYSDAPSNRNYKIYYKTNA